MREHVMGKKKLPENTLPTAFFNVRQVLWFLVVALVIVGDRFSKLWVVQHLDYQIPYAIFPFFNFTLAFNQGAAFSFLHDADGWQQWLFVGFAFVVSIILSFWLVHLPKAHKVLSLSLALIIGGALGNVYDRLKWHYVIDFCDFHIGTWHFAIFNVADSAISIGTGLLLYALWQSDRRPHS